MLCKQCSKDIDKGEFVERNGTKICLICDDNNKNFFKSLDNKKFKEVLLKYQELDNFDESNKDWLIKHTKSMLDDFANLRKNADDKASLWIKEQEKELRKLLFTLKIKIPEIINGELILFTLVNEKTNDNLFVVFPRGDKKILDIQLKWCQIFLLYMEVCTDEKGNFRYSKFRKISQKISCLSPFPAIFTYKLAPKEIKGEVKNTFLKSMKELEEEISKKGYNANFLFFDLIKSHNPTYLLQW